MNNKKGISAIVATVLIILITVAAVTIIWAAIIPMVTDGLAGATVCSTADMALTLEDKGYTCIDGDEVKVQVSRNSEEMALVGIQILVSEGGSTQSDPISVNLPNVNGESVLTATLNDYTNAEFVSIAPVITVGNTDKICTVSNKVALIDCA